jgi:hypothetical protein
VAGRFGYCSLDRSRATLLGDEVRACWQPPVRDETFDGLFRELSVVADPVTSDRPAMNRTLGVGTGGTRTWAIPVHGTPGAPSSGSPAGGSNGTSQGLVEAPFVPARGIRSAAAHLVPGGRELFEVEVQRSPSGTAVGRDDPNAHEPISGGGPDAAQADP